MYVASERRPLIILVKVRKPMSVLKGVCTGVQTRSGPKKDTVKLKIGGIQASYAVSPRNPAPHSNQIRKRTPKHPHMVSQ